MPKAVRAKSVTKELKGTYEAIVLLTDNFCRTHLNQDYRELAQEMAAALCRKRPSPVGSGPPRSWACGIVWTLGRINFLSDPASKPYMTMAEVCAGFGVSQSTTSAKMRVIWNALDTFQFDPRWTVRSMLDQNPLVWLAEVDGLMVDLRQMPREVQEAAFETGVIPYIPADRKR
jgi:hypothetical protein